MAKVWETAASFVEGGFWVFPRWGLTLRKRWQELEVWLKMETVWTTDWYCLIQDEVGGK